MSEFVLQVTTAAGQQLPVLGDAQGRVLVAGGAVGPAGPQGPAGPAGATGATGAAGPTGPAGSYTAGAGISLANDVLSIATTSNGFGTRTVSTSSPSGGLDGDIWLKV
jgi:hypothetical protein